MPDRELESSCSSEQSVYALFKERHKKKLFAERIWNNIDDIEDEDLYDNEEDDRDTND